MGVRRYGISLRYLTSKRSERVRYRVNHEWWKYLKGTPVNIMNSFLRSELTFYFARLWKVSLEMVCINFNL